MRAATATFLGFLAAGVVPLLPFVMSLFRPVQETFFWSSLLAGLTFFGIGLAKGRVLEGHLVRTGLETLAVGGGAAIISYLAGDVLARLLDGVF